MAHDIEARIIENGDDSLPILSNDTLMQLADKAEKQIQAINKIKLVALKVTNPQDWTDQGGKPYLQVSGAEKVARVFGISWRIDEPVFDQEADGHFSYTYKGYFTLGGTTIEIIGSRSSKDKFFTKYGYEGEGDNRKKIELPPSEIDKGDLKKAAFTNLLGNGITRILGIRNLTWEEVRAGGIDPTKVNKVEYGKGSKGGNEGAGTSYPITEGQRKMLFAKMQSKKMDEAVFKVQFGLASLNDLPKNKMNDAIKFIDEYQGGSNAQSTPEICSECREPLKSGKCHNPSCNEAVPE